MGPRFGKRRPSFDLRGVRPFSTRQKDNHQRPLSLPILLFLFNTLFLSRRLHFFSPSYSFFPYFFLHLFFLIKHFVSVLLSCLCGSFDRSLLFFFFLCLFHCLTCVLVPLEGYYFLHVANLYHTFEFYVCFSGSLVDEARDGFDP